MTTPQPAAAPARPGAAGLDRIELSADVTLTGSLPNITTSMIIDGNGYTITGGGSGSNFRLTEVAVSSNAIIVTFTDVTIDDFRHDTRGTLEVDNDKARITISKVAFTDNTNYSSSSAGGAIQHRNSSSFFITQSVFKGNTNPSVFGGAIYSRDTHDHRVHRL